MKRSLALFSIAAVLPVIVFGAGISVWSLHDDRHALEDQAEDQARFVATVVSRELAANIRSVQMISQSPGLDGPIDEARLRTLGERLVADEPSWSAISVSDPAGNRLLDTPEPVSGIVGGRVVELTSHQRAVQERRPTVGRIVDGPRHKPAFAVRAPVIRNGQVLYVVSAVVEPKALRPLLLPASLPKDWRVEVIDGSGRVVARSDGADGELGKQADSAALKASASGRPGPYHDHDEVIVWRPVRNTDWTVHVAMPASAYNAPITQAVQVLLVGVLISLVLTGLFARLLVRELGQYRLREERALESQRLEALGQMTGGVAHDFNNLLTPILGGLDLLRPKLAGDPRSQRLLDGALVSAERARTLVGRLLAFARRQALETRDVDVVGLLRGLSDLLERSVGPNVVLKIETPEGLPSVRADPAQLELAILNLSVNARDAMPSGGELTIACSQGDGRSAGLPEGHYVCICVIDTGAGMDAATLRRAIEPFFTTKAQGKGTGLGLSMVHGLAAQSGGALRMSSTVGAGTRAEIWLPAGATVSEQPMESEDEADPRKGKLLLVDDDDLVRASTAAVLRDHGHEVMEAHSAFEALSILKEHGPFEVLVTDYAMPGMNGRELILEARKAQPQLPALLITGFASYDQALPPDVGSLGKPFRRVELLNRIARLLPENVSA